MIRLLVCLLLAAAAATAQGPFDMPKKGWPWAFGPIGIGKAMQKTGMSEAQMRQIDEIFRSHRNNLIDLRAEMEKSEADLKDLLDSPQVDLAAAEKAVDRVMEARQRLGKVTSMMMVRMRQVLTLEQWEKLQDKTLTEKVRAAAPPASTTPRRQKD